MSQRCSITSDVACTDRGLPVKGKVLFSHEQTEALTRKPGLQPPAPYAVIPKETTPRELPRVSSSWRCTCFSKASRFLRWKCLGFPAKTGQLRPGPDFSEEISGQSHETSFSLQRSQPYLPASSLLQPSHVCV